MVKLPFCLFLFVLAVALKFWLIWETEITDATDDSHEYVLQILHPVNGGLSYPPGTGMAGRLLYDFGIPYRLGLETAFLFASALVLRSLFDWPWQHPLSLALFAFVAFDPAIAALFTHLYSDQVWLVETLLGLALFVLAYGSEKKVRPLPLFASLAFFSLALITRSTAVPIILSIILFVLFALAFILAKYRSPRLKKSLDRLAIAAPVLILGLSLFYFTACRYNFLHHGYTGLSYIDSKEYKDFYVCLQSVGDPDGPRYFPIDENRRKLIAQAGPDSAWFIGQLEKNTVYKQAGIDFYHRNDIPAGWFHWATFTATVLNGDYISAFTLFHGIEKEISDAAQKGTIKVRPVASLPDSRIPIVLAASPAGLWNSIGKMVEEPTSDVFTSDKSTYLDPDFDHALNRRPVKPDPYRENIWACLATVYSWIYTPVLFCLYPVAKIAFCLLLFKHWKQINYFPPLFLARQIYAFFFAIFLLWYAFFDASGMPVIARYMLFNHLLLPILLAYYISAFFRLRRLGKLQENPSSLAW